uniref:Uncharacterized protein n=2 Tax=Saimiriine herpesvirus 2 TaxID=10381 RepID=Q9Q1U5_SHV2|nr:hypothetical protein [Saimiriine gammaherpesvirus 2]CAC84300.1 hypothetical protein [Saimiriine gammaherpesvirus 2]
MNNEEEPVYEEIHPLRPQLVDTENLDLDIYDDVCFLEDNSYDDACCVYTPLKKSSVEYNQLKTQTENLEVHIYEEIV